VTRADDRDSAPSAELLRYYAERAPDFDKVYARPERQGDLRALRNLLSRWFAGQRVLEVACGTGYWTGCIAGSAHSVLATDLSDEMLAVARRRHFQRGNVSLQRVDALSLEGVPKDFTAAFAGFWWSHVPRRLLPGFLRALNAHLRPGALVVFVDNRFVEGSCSPMADRTDEDGNTYSVRRLRDDSVIEVLKNFPTRRELLERLMPIGSDVQFVPFTYYWCVRYHALAGEESH
jgi:demethylmenaquinone methyltransferase/2-methoxy-6-polyprenyl-1,4-benzoquinol methylase